MALRTRTLAASMALACAAAVTLGACSSSGGSSANGKVTLNVVGFEGGGTELADIPEINAAFEKAYPNVTINYKYVANSEYEAYNNTRLAAGTAADVLMVNPYYETTWVQQGFLSDLSDQSWVSTLLPKVKPFAQRDGKTYAFIQQNIPIGLYANLDLLKRAGIDSVPTTWPEFLSDLQTLKAKGDGGIEVPNLQGWDAEQLSLALAANLIDTSWGSKYDSGGSTWAATWSPVIDKLKQLLSSGYVDGKTMNGIDPFVQGPADFASGKYAFFVDGAWDLSHYKQTASFNFSLNPFPGGAAGSTPKTFTFIGSGWSVYSQSPNQTAAKEYVAFMAQPAQDSAYLAAESSFTTLTDVPSPHVAASAPVYNAFSAGDTSPSQIEFIADPDSENKFKPQLTALFSDPSKPDAALLSALDQQIPKTASK
ncbi:extracellular solute-binding protein [Actinospica sp. MGRD01-02]|uniref:Extracellular solute-binding protein n=1 Tax=Actinospica acidithermotolerans TaxID=2828514 RepID=A0A941EC27_9ACTN|nr:extracellular solute-binding protein [Actinospica acidithermotolerans]MBR7825124.1 extracellular solute-binding protein [Actinospica acidithermotolerans]